MPSEQQPMITWYEEQFGAFEKSLNGGRTSEIHALRRKGIAAFAALGFPTPRQEEWRFTNIAPITKTAFQPSRQSADLSIVEDRIRPLLLAGAWHLVFVNGQFAPSVSHLAGLPAGVMVSALSEALQKHPNEILPALGAVVRSDENAFTALNTAFLQEGAFIAVRDGMDVERPIQVLFAAHSPGGPTLIQPRNIVIGGARSRFTIVEQYVGVSEHPYLTNAVTEISLGARAVLEHDRVQEESLEAYHVDSLQVHLRRDCRYTSTAVSLGGAIARSTIGTVLDDEGIECTLNGLLLATGTQLLDSHTAIDHARPNCASHELYKSILDGQSHGVFNGKIFVRKDAQKTDAKQTNKTLLLSDDAVIDTKPQLEIFADDVKCTHGATVGQLDDEQIFYLRSRGIAEADARDILTYAFASDVIGRIAVEGVRTRLEPVIHARLSRARTTEHARVHQS